jgi:hypothetical protein
MANLHGGTTIGGYIIATYKNFRRLLKVLTNVTLSGDVSGTGNFDDNGNLGITTVVANDSHTHSDSTVTGTETSTGDTIVQRNGSGDINTRLFRSEYDTTNASCNYFMTQVDTASNNYIRPSTKAQVRNALGKMDDSDKIDGYHVTKNGAGGSGIINFIT